MGAPCTTSSLVICFMKTKVQHRHSCSVEQWCSGSRAIMLIRKVFLLIFKVHTVMVQRMPFLALWKPASKCRLVSCKILRGSRKMLELLNSFSLEKAMTQLCVNCGNLAVSFSTGLYNLIWGIWDHWDKLQVQYPKGLDFKLSCINWMSGTKDIFCITS